MSWRLALPVVVAKEALLNAFLVTALLTFAPAALAQTPPSASEVAAYDGLHRAAYGGDVEGIRRLISQGADVNARDPHGRTPAHVAAFASQNEALRALAEVGADMNALEGQAYDVVTIAAVADDPGLMSLAIELGNDPSLVTSPYDGTALIAAAHLGHDEVVRRLIVAGAPLDHVNNLGWTALIESIVLGDGGKNHTDTLEALVKAGANLNLADRAGFTPLRLAQVRGYSAMVKILETAGAK
jgi:ankyrin repeat protein